jgi:hypothetical protein
MILKLCVIDLTNVESIYTHFIEIYLKLSPLNGKGNYLVE